MGFSEVYLDQMTKLLEELVLLQPQTYTLPQLADMCAVSREGLRKHLMSNYRIGIDYFQKRESGAITIKRDVCIKIRRYYER